MAKPEGTKSFDLSGAISLYEPRPRYNGRFSNIYCGSWKGEQKVAIKVIKTINTTQSFKRKVQQERMKWTRLEHPNILQFYGYATDEEFFGPFGAFISPWCKYGDAATFLKEQGEAIGLKTRLGLWEGVVKGTCYLHQFNPSIVHGDLKPGNVLIDDTMNVRLCDFGLLEMMLDEDDNIITNINHSGTERYLAHELVASDDVAFPTMASDIWALGCVGLWFMFLKVPYAERANNLQGRIFKDIAEGKPPARRSSAGDPVISEIYGIINGVWDIFETCWALDPGARPKAEEVQTAVEKLLPSSAMTPPTHRVSHSIPAITTEFIRNTEEMAVEKETPIFESIPFSTNHFGQKILFCACPLSYTAQIAFGTEDGVYLADVREPDKPPAKVINLPKVTHIDVLEEGSLLLALSERNIYPFSLHDLDPRSPPIDAKRVKPVTSDVSFFELGHTMGKSLVVAVRSGNQSTKVKIFEPSERTKSEKSSGIFRKNSQTSSSQDKSATLKLWKEFYMPTDAYSLSFLKGKLCFGSPKGFQVVDLQTLNHTALISGGDESLAWISTRHKLLPLAVLRHNGEFLLCYDQFSLFVDMRGYRSRPQWTVDWEGRPISFILRDPYIIAIGAATIEICDINDPSTKQLIPAQGLRCLFAENPLDGISYQLLTQPNSNSKRASASSGSSSQRNSGLGAFTQKSNRDSQSGSSPLSPLSPYSESGAGLNGVAAGGSAAGLGRHEILLSSNENILLLKPAMLQDPSQPPWNISLDSFSSNWHKAS